jgi:hypothetical protein
VEKETMKANVDREDGDKFAAGVGQECCTGESSDGTLGPGLPAIGELSGPPVLEPSPASATPAKGRRVARWVLVGLGAAVVLFLGWEVVIRAGKLTERVSEVVKLRLAASANLAAQGIPPRDSQARPELIDLSAFYSTALTNSTASGEKGNDLSEVPQGLQTMAGVEFDVRGFVQLSASGLIGTPRDVYPAASAEIPVNRKVNRLHFLQGAIWHESPGAKVGSYYLRYADGQVAEFPIVYGRHVQDWWFYGSDRDKIEGAEVAWVGQNRDIRRFNAYLHLYKMTVQNPRPDVAVVSLDFASTMTKCAPFLIAITVE